jgi:hypothetical protein
VGRARAIALLICAAMAGCGADGHPRAGRTLAAAGSVAPVRASRAALAAYIAAVEPIRVSVNRLLDGADPVLHALHEHRLSARGAARRMDRLEVRFAGYTVAIASVTPRLPALAGLHREYAHTYVLEDAYLSALASGIGERDLAHLPDTQSQQRAAIINWRTGLTVLARRLDVALPADLQQAGRGEIAPSSQGGS